MFIFYDNSNIHYSGLDSVRPMIEPSSDMLLYRTHFINLFEVVRDNRTVTDAYAASSVPPPNNELWNHLERLNISVKKITKTTDGKEQEGVDYALQTQMFRTMCDHEPSVMAVLTGDGKGAESGEGFLADLRRIHNKFGWDVEVYAWENTCNRHLREFAEKEGKFIGLEKYYYSITFLKGVRPVQPLHIW